MNTKYTPGPWRWEINRQGKRIQLCGGKPAFDKTVMDFTRWGMQAAQPRFQHEHFMQEAKEFATNVAGREHHSTWFQTINHPDALLIAAAPELLEALQAIRPLLGGLLTYARDHELDMAQGDMVAIEIRKIDALISKATAQEGASHA